MKKQDATLPDGTTWANGCEVHLGLRGDRRAVIPQVIADNQGQYDGKTFIALLPERGAL